MSVIELMPISTILWAVFFILIIAYIRWWWKTRHLYDLASKIPLPENYSKYPLIGHGHHFIGKSMEENLNTIMNFGSGPEPLYRGSILHRVSFLTTSPEIYDAVLNSPHCLAKSDMYKLFAVAMGDGLLSCEVAKWKRVRKLISPTFKPQYINQFVDIFNKKTNILIDVLKSKEGKTVDMFLSLEKCNVDLVIESLSGYEFDTQRTSTPVPNIGRAMEICMLQMFNVLYQIKPIFKLTSMAKEQMDIRTSFYGLFTDVLQRKEKEWLTKNPEDLINKPRKVLLDILMESKGALSESEVRDQMQTMVVAGLDTGTTEIAFTLMMLAMHPDIEEKVYQEVINVIGHKRLIEYEDLVKLEYLEKVIKETMRLFPAAPIVARRVDADLKLETCTIPKGTEVVLLYLQTHRSPKYYKDPLKFDPERFSPEEIAKRHPYAYTPFSGGPRICLGIRYAMMMMKSQIALLVRDFRLFTDYKTVESIRIQPNMIITATMGYPMRVKSRRNQ